MVIAPIWAAASNAPGYMIFTVTLVVLAAALVIAATIRGILKSSAKTGQLRLHVYADERHPTRLSDSNIFRYYYMRNIVHIISPAGREETGNAFLFVSFVDDVIINTLEVTSPDAKLPRHEVKEYNQRYAIIVLMSFCLFAP